MKPGITVIICTYNGASLLPETLRHIALQCVRPDIPWEVIVVNNASTDDTAEVVTSEWETYQVNVPFRLLHQPLKGLTHAREMALANAQYEFVLFCDDDNWLSPDYLTLAYDLMQKHPSIGILGGYGEMVFESPPPLWAMQLHAFASGPQAKTSGKVKHNAVYGAGCVLRTTAYTTLSKAGYKPMLTDRKGVNLSTGGDYELCYAIALAGYAIWYDERLRFKHFMPKERISLEYCIRFFKEGATSFQVLIPYRIRVNANSRSLTAFNLRIVRSIFFYTKKLIPLLLAQLTLQPGSEEYLVNRVKLISLKYKLLSLKKYSLMRGNFLKILEFEKTSLTQTIEIKRGAEREEVNRNNTAW